ncbi:hypothetical protein MXAN_6091 [Myxococcus xanthus DK 1622]|uniref:Uncharacterized protein n=1 Tax=Myxococcus xanthus (strain DK1622) TaxID=246197 RepID=Q1CZE7_MYXXD|nr:hypothetical protein MXAN_6091 [Myxococcus xanthus DK 1622]
MLHQEAGAQRQLLGEPHGQLRLAVEEHARVADDAHQHLHVLLEGDVLRQAVAEHGAEARATQVDVRQVHPRGVVLEARLVGVAEGGVRAEVGLAALLLLLVPPQHAQTAFAEGARLHALHVVRLRAPQQVAADDVGEAPVAAQLQARVERHHLGHSLLARHLGRTAAAIGAVGLDGVNPVVRRALGAGQATHRQGGGVTRQRDEAQADGDVPLPLLLVGGGSGRGRGGRGRNGGGGGALGGLGGTGAGLGGALSRDGGALGGDGGALLHAEGRGGRGLRGGSRRRGRSGRRRLGLQGRSNQEGSGKHRVSRSTTPAKSLSPGVEVLCSPPMPTQLPSCFKGPPRFNGLMLEFGHAPPPPHRVGPFPPPSRQLLKEKGPCPCPCAPLRSCCSAPCSSPPRPPPSASPSRWTWGWGPRPSPSSAPCSTTSPSTPG